MAEEKKEKKIIIDEDWKTKAQREKEVLKAKEKVDKEDKETEQEQQTQQQPLPPGNFSALVSLLATQALFAMGAIATEKDKEPKKDLRLAKFHIDMLEAIEEKTKGNLTEQEQKLLSGTLSQLRMGFVNTAG
jgi:hypothetical protein